MIFARSRDNTSDPLSPFDSVCNMTAYGPRRPVARRGFTSKVPLTADILGASVRVAPGAATCADHGHSAPTKERSLALQFLARSKGLGSASCSGQTFGLPRQCQPRGHRSSRREIPSFLVKSSLTAAVRSGHSPHSGKALSYRPKLSTRHDG